MAKPSRVTRYVSRRRRRQRETKKLSPRNTKQTFFRAQTHTSHHTRYYRAWVEESYESFQHKCIFSYCQLERYCSKLVSEISLLILQLLKIYCESDDHFGELGVGPVTKLYN